MGVKGILEKATSPSIRHQLTKLMLATLAGFAATKLVENAYDKVTHQDDTTTED